MKTKTKNQTKQSSKKTEIKATRKFAAKKTKTTMKSQTKSPSFISARPKTVVLTVERSANGYTIQEATLLNKINQYSSRAVSIDIRSITSDINKKGFIA